jgi:hypothetical protein
MQIPLSEGYVMRTVRAEMLLVALLATSGFQSAFAGNVICVMRFNSNGSNPCAMSLPQFGEVVERDHQDRLMCVRRYEDRFCKYNKNEFYHALGKNGESVCVMNFNQQLIGNPCSRNSEQYGYAAEPW